MKYEGKWRIHSHMTIDEERGSVYMTLDELAARDPDDDTAQQMKGYVIEFTPEGEMITTMPVPEGTPKEAIEEAKSQGMTFINDDTVFVLERHPWREEEDGTVMIDSGVKGEVLGEEIDPWAPLEELEDGLLQYLMMRLERIG